MLCGLPVLFFVLNAALLHDIGDVALLPQGQKGFKEEETLEERQRVARIGANMLRDIDGFQEVAAIIEVNQDPYLEYSSSSPDFLLNRMAQTIHLADFVAASLNTDTPVLNQVKRIVDAAQELSGTEFCSDV